MSLIARSHPQSLGVDTGCSRDLCVTYCGVSSANKQVVGHISGWIVGVFEES